jgi:hypothetical protein
MKTPIFIPAFCLCILWLPASVRSEPADPAAEVPAVQQADSEPEESPEELRAKHQEGSVVIADEQDELKADVQQLIIEQTIPKVIELLSEVEDIMNEATDLLAEAETGGETIAAQTEIIEKIHAAAKERQGQSGAGQSGGAMMDMMERMMGKEPGEKGEQPGGKGEKPGEQGGEGQTGLSDAANEATGGAAAGSSEERRVPKAAGTAGREIPEEFRRALDAYNRGAEEKIK